MFQIIENAIGFKSATSSSDILQHRTCKLLTKVNTYICTLISSDLWVYTAYLCNSFITVYKFMYFEGGGIASSVTWLVTVGMTGLFYGRGRDFSLCHIWTSSWAQWAYLLGTRGSFSCGKVVEAWSWLLSSNVCQH